MELAWKVFEVSINALEPFLDVYLFICLFPSRPRFFRYRIIPVICTIIIGFLWIQLTSTCLEVNYAIQTVFLIAIYFGFLFVFRSGHWIKKLFWVASANAIFASIVYAVSQIQVFLMGIEVSELFVQGQLRFVNMSLIHIIYTLFVGVVIQHKSARIETNATKMLAMIFIYAANICVLLLVDYASIYVKNDTWDIVCAATATGTLLSSLTTLWLFTLFSIQERTMLQLRAQAYYIEIQQKFLQDIESLYGQIRAWRHDYHHHIEVIHGALLKNEIEEAKTYIANYLKDAHVPKHFYSTKNVMIDALLSTKLMSAENSGIKIKSHIVIPDVLPLNDVDMCTLLGNLIDNSIEACQKVTSQDPKIELEISPIGGNLCIQIINSTFDKSKVVGKEIPTTKQNSDMHGIGLKSVEMIISKAQGYCDRCHDNYQFKTIVMLPIRIISKEGK